MAYKDSSGKIHVSLSEASNGHAAQHTASRDAAGSITGNSTGSRAEREQEARKAAAQQEAQKATYQQQITITPAQQQQQKESFLSRTWGALKQGYSAGEGKGFSLSGLRGPDSKNTYTASLFEKTNSLAKSYDIFQNKALSSLSPGVGKDFLTGVTNIPEIVIQTAGAIPYGSEAILRNPSSISDSVFFGAGAMAGGIVQKGKTHPAELAGELIAGYGLSKGMSKAAPKVKEAASVPSLKQFAINERASLGPSKRSMYLDTRPIRPSQKLELVYDKESKYVDRTLIREPKTETFHVVGDKLVPESSMKINSVKLGSDVKLTPEMESVLFGKKSTGPIKEADNFITVKNKIPSEESSMKIDSIRLGSDVKLTPEMESVLFGKKSQQQQYAISSIKIGEDVKLTPEMESVLFRKANSKETFNPRLLDKQLERDIFSPELTKPTKYKINNVFMEESLSFPLAASFSPALAYNVPSLKEEQNQKQKKKTKPIIDPFFDTTFKPKIDPFIDTTFKPKIDPVNPGPIDPFIPNIDPVNPGPIDPFIPDIDPVNPGPIDPFIPDIETIIINKKVIIPSAGDFDLLGPKEKPRKGKRKTKQKMIKNDYGDPFKLKF